jgi:hypothetical protein
MYDLFNPNCGSVAVLTDGALRGLEFADMISEPLNSTSTSTESDLKFKDLVYHFDVVKIEMQNVNDEMARVKKDIPVYIGLPANSNPDLGLIAKLERSEHVQNAIQDSYLFQKVEEIKAVHAAEASKQLAKAAALEAKAAALEAKFAALKVKGF